MATCSIDLSQTENLKLFITFQHINVSCVHVYISKGRTPVVFNPRFSRNISEGMHYHIVNFLFLKVISRLTKHFTWMLYTLIPQN